MKPEIEKRLEDLVEAAPKTPPNKNHCWCALSRVAWQVDNTARIVELFLDGYGIELGLTQHEAYGVMHGWDLAARNAGEDNFPCFGGFLGEPYFDAGVEFGMYLYRKYGAES